MLTQVNLKKMDTILQKIVYYVSPVQEEATSKQNWLIISWTALKTFHGNSNVFI